MNLGARTHRHWANWSNTRRRDRPDRVDYLDNLAIRRSFSCPRRRDLKVYKRFPLTEVVGGCMERNRPIAKEIRSDGSHM